jgi:hypothetical protein
MNMDSNRIIRLPCLVYQNPLELGSVLLKSVKAHQNNVWGSRSSSVNDYINKRLGIIRATS